LILMCRSFLLFIDFFLFVLRMISKGWKIEVVEIRRSMGPHGSFLRSGNWRVR
jgi:hypothetical protein